MSKLGNQTICQNFQKKNKLQKEKTRGNLSERVKRKRRVVSEVFYRNE